MFKRQQIETVTLKEIGRLAGRDDIEEIIKSGSRVIEAADGWVIKFFRNKGVLSSAWFVPYALRFLKNTRRLKAIGISTITVDKLYYVPETGRTAAVYKRLPGITLREKLKNCDAFSGEELLKKFSVFLSSLHNKGVLFRAGHFGNVLVLPSGEFAVIDVADMTIRRSGGLGLADRLRNFRHISRYDEEKSYISAYGTERFIGKYLEVSDISRLSRRMLARLIVKILA